MSDLARAADDAQLPPDLRAAAPSLQRVAELADQPHGGEATVTYTDRPALIRDFGAGAREDIEGEVRVTQQLGNLHISQGGGYRGTQEGTNGQIAPTYAASPRVLRAV